MLEEGGKNRLIEVSSSMEVVIQHEGDPHTAQEAKFQASLEVVEEGVLEAEIASPRWAFPTYIDTNAQRPLKLDCPEVAGESRCCFLSILSGGLRSRSRCFLMLNNGVVVSVRAGQEKLACGPELPPTTLPRCH